MDKNTQLRYIHHEQQGERLNMVHTPWSMAEGGHSLPTDVEKGKRDLYGNVYIWEYLRSKHTAFSYWRRGLIEVLKGYEFDEAEGKKFINFLLSTFRFAIISASEHGPGSPVRILYNLAPSRLNLVSWRRILVGMNIVLEEPDTNNDIQLIGVTLGSKVVVETFVEFCQLLELLKECNWQTLQTIIEMQPGYQLALLQILEYCKETNSIHPSMIKNIKILYELDMFSMRQIGFYRANESEPVSWNRPRNDTHLTFISVLYGLYGSLLKDITVPKFQSLPH